MKVAIVGGGWAGMAAAVAAVQAGHTVTVFEAARSLGGRARAVSANLPDGTPITLDNGQHILIGAYVDTLRLMRLVGVEPASTAATAAAMPAQPPPTMATFTACLKLAPSTPATFCAAE